MLINVLRDFSCKSYTRIKVYVNCCTVGNTPFKPLPWKNLSSPWHRAISPKNECWSPPVPLPDQSPLKFEKKNPNPWKKFFHWNMSFLLVDSFWYNMCVCYLQLFVKILALLSYSKVMTNSQLLFWSFQA